MYDSLLISFAYGISTMFYAMMSWLFWRKSPDYLSRLVAILTAFISIECIKDIICYINGTVQGSAGWMIMSAWDMLVVPLYAAILVELCQPGNFSARSLIISELTFVIPATILSITGQEIVFDILLVWCMIFSIYYATWTIFAITKYNTVLKERFSYDDNIHLYWLHWILYSFFLILALWIASCIFDMIILDIVYLLGSVILWMVICYFIYRHESIVKELQKFAESSAKDEETSAGDDDDPDSIGAKICALFYNEKIFLDSKLKLSDVARLAGSNRTYVSNWFNRDPKSSFYDFVNNLRVEYACDLLRHSKDSLSTIAERSGFNSLSTFHRVFSSRKGMTPNEYRTCKESTDCNN